MKKYLLLASLCLLQHFLIAQAFDIEIQPNPAIVSEAVDTISTIVDISVDSEISTTSSDTVWYDWKIVDIQMPIGWKVLICDVNQA